MSSYFGHVLKYQKNAGNLKIKVQLSPDQTIATNTPTQHIGGRNIGGRNMLRAFGHLVATGCGMLDVVGSDLASNNTQHVATHRNTVAKRTHHVAPNNVAICCDRLAGA